MDNRSYDEVPSNRYAVIEQGDPSEISTLDHQFTQFRVAIPKGALTAGSSRGSSYFEWSIVTDPAEIDEVEEGKGEDEIGQTTDAGEGNDEIELSDDEGGEENGPDEIDNVCETGRELDCTATSPISSSLNRNFPNIPLPAPGPLKGYEYTKFNPTPATTPITHNSPDVHMLPPQPNALAALTDLNTILHPSRNTGRGYKDPDIDLWRRARLEGMVSMLNMFTNAQSRTYNQWGASACQAAIGMGRGRQCARQLRELNRAFLADRKILPINPYGDWNKSLLVNENILNEIKIYLLSLGNEITAKKLQDFLHQADIKEKYGIERDISHKTACRYLQALGYRYQSTPKGQYVDGHEREDVITYRKKVFLPKWKKFMDRMVTWDKELKEYPPSARQEKRVIAWFHDESIFYAHDRKKKDGITKMPVPNLM